MMPAVPPIRFGNANDTAIRISIGTNVALSAALDQSSRSSPRCPTPSRR
jgi:hypothetical protein